MFALKTTSRFDKELTLRTYKITPLQTQVI